MLTSSGPDASDVMHRFNSGAAAPDEIPGEIKMSIGRPTIVYTTESLGY